MGVSRFVDEITVSQDGRSFTFRYDAHDAGNYRNGSAPRWFDWTRRSSNIVQGGPFSIAVYLLSTENKGLRTHLYPFKRALQGHSRQFGKHFSTHVKCFILRTGIAV